MALVRVYDKQRKAKYTIGSRAAEADENLKVLDEDAARDGRALPAEFNTSASKQAASGS